MWFYQLTNNNRFKDRTLIGEYCVFAVGDNIKIMQSKTRKPIKKLIGF